METKTSLDIDNLNTKVLKKVVDQISIPFAYIINLSFESGILPNRLKISRTVPVYKGKHIPDIEFVFNNNDFGVPENPDLIYPTERIKNDSACPAYKVLGIYIHTLMKT